MAEFVAEYAQVLLCKDISPLERTEREKHLVSLTYFAQQQEWSVILNFHGSVLLDIERGLVTWGGFYLHLESRTLYGHPLQEILQRQVCFVAIISENNALALKTTSGLSMENANG